MKIPFAAGECLFDVAAELVLQRIASYNVGPPKIGFPVLKHRTEVQKDDVILSNRQVWRILIVWSQGIAPCAYDAFVPIARDPIHAPSKHVDVLIDFLQRP